MLDFSCTIEAEINASPQVVFDIVSDLPRHVELAGSGELHTVQKDPQVRSDRARGYTPRKRSCLPTATAWR